MENTMKNMIILNIPHSSLKLPKEFVKVDKLLNKKQIEKFNIQMTDLFTNKLFSCKNFCHIKSKYSRIACDMEKFVDDDKEIMAKYGLGVIYQNDLNNNLIFSNIDKDYKNIMLGKYYYPYHKKLDKKVKKNLKHHNVILIDCHSFSKDIIMDNTKKEDLPDICIGFDKKFCSQKLVDFACQYFNQLGYKTKVNYPYEGSIVPNCLIDLTNPKFQSIMLEINREIYLENLKPNINFKSLKLNIKRFINILKNFK